MNKQQKLAAIETQIAELNDVLAKLQKKADKLRLKQQRKAIKKIEDLDSHQTLEFGILKDEVMTEFKDLVGKLKNILSKD